MITEITKEATLANIPHIMEWLDDALGSIDCPNKAHMQINVAADEILGNIVFHAYPDKAGDVTVRIEHQDGSGLFSMTFIVGPVRTGKSTFIKKMMDNVSYEYKDGSNVLSISKSLAE